MREVLDLALTECEDVDLFWHVVKDEASKKCPLNKTQETNIRPMNDTDGGKFGRQSLGFGTWTDCTYEHVWLQDPDYLEWLADKGMNLLRWLKWRKGKV